MKKLINLLISLLICVLMLLTGCGTPSASLPSELVGKTTANPDTLNIIAPNFFFGSDDENAENANKQWQDEMSSRYGVKINVITSSYAEDGTYKSAYLQQTDTFSGLVQTEDMYAIQDAIKSNSAVPLEDYLADNTVWNALPDDIKSTFKINGHIYAIPTSVTPHMFSRIFYKDSLQQTGTVTDLVSLKEFAAAYAKTTGNQAIDLYSNTDIADILNAFGLYGNFYDPITYDPTEDCYVDFLTKGAAIDALEYLRELYVAGGLNYCEKYSDVSQNFSNHITASIKSSYGYYTLDDFREVLTLNPKYPQVIFNQVFGFYMTKDTVQPKETINFFVNMLFGSEQNYLDCWLGSSDGYTLNSDGTITVKMVQNSDGSYTDPAMPKLTGGFSGFFAHSDADLLYSQNGVVTKDSETEEGKKNKMSEGLNDALAKGIVIKIPPAYTMINCQSYYTNYMDIYNLYKTCLEDAITATDWTVQQVIDDYKEQMLNLGGNAMLDEMNAAIGKKTAYYYG